MTKMKTTTAEALLGMLTLGPMSGYDLRQRIDQSIGNFWSESFGQIYPTLKRMEEEGFVTSLEEGKAGRLVYSLTEAGKARLAAWLEVPPRLRAPRNELLLKLFFGRIAPVEPMRAHVLETRRKYEEDLVRYERMAPAICELHQGKPGLPFYRMALSYGIREARMIVEWCDETLAALHAIGANGAAADEKKDVELAGARRM
jgi:PadR family transcriptional regulator AphA